MGNWSRASLPCASLTASLQRAKSMESLAGTTQPGGNPQRQAGSAECRLSETPSTDLTLTYRAQGLTQHGLNCLSRGETGLQMQLLGPPVLLATRECVHPCDLPLLLCQCRSTSAKTRGTNLLGFLGASSKGALIRPVIGVFLWHPQSPALYAITSWVSWLIPQKEKVQAGAKQQQTQVWAHLPPVPRAVPPSSHTPCHPGAKGDHLSSLQTRLAARCLEAGCDAGTPRLRTVLWHRLS